MKKPTLDPKEFKNFIPVAKLKFVEKTIAICRSNPFLHVPSFRNLYGRSQYAFFFLRVETAMLRIFNNLLLDRRQEAVIVMLDYSFAFDTITYEILLLRLS